MKKKFILTAGLLLAIGAAPVFGQSSKELSALSKRLQELEKKTSRLEEENRRLLDREIGPPKESDATKIKLTKGISELKLGGDLRLRYQYDHSDRQVEAPGAKGQQVNRKGDQRSRWRYRLRLNADFKLGDHWFGGVSLATGDNADSGFIDYSGGFGKDQIYISRAFLGWEPNDAITLLFGKQPNPLYKSELVWSNDINPTGLSQTLRIHKFFEGEDEEGKAISTPWELSLVAGQYVFDTTNNESAIDGDLKSDAYLFVQQIVASYKFSKDVKATLAPTLLLYNAANINSARNATPFSDANIANRVDQYGNRIFVGATRDLQLVQAPGEVAFKLFNQRAKFLWDISYNLNGAKRTRDIYGQLNHSGKDDLAWLIGFQVGDNRKKGDWQAAVNYRQVGLASIDPNLNDSTFALSRLNVKGWKAAVSYNFTDNVLGAVTFTTADDLRKDLIGGQATGGAGLANLNSVQTLQVDLNVKF